MSSRVVLSMGRSVVLKVILAISLQCTAGMAPTVAQAQEVLEPGCFVDPARLTDKEMRAFLSDPAGLLKEFPEGGLEMSSRVRALAGSSASALDPLFALVSRSTNPQVSAMAAGLARAARACAPSNPVYAVQLQERVAGIDNEVFIAAFIAASNEVQTAALGTSAASSAGGAASGIGSGGVAGGGSAGSNNSEGTATGVTAFSNPSRQRFFSSSTTVIQISPN